MPPGTCNHLAMHINSTTLDNPLDSVISQLRHICDDRDLLKSSIDAGSVSRMLVHVTNINVSVLASTRDHINASKRLNDFALTLVRMAMKSESPNELLTARMSSVAANLRAASEQLTRTDAVPNWRAPAAAH
jgi:hypothetical protein